MKKFYLKIWFIILLSINTLNLPAQEIIIGYSDIFTLGTQINQVTPILGYTDIFPLNTILGSSFDGYSGLFNFNTIGAPVSADFTASDTVVEINEEIQFTYLQNKSFEAISWLWNFGDGSPVSTDPNPTHTYSTPAIYDVTLIVENQQGVQNTRTKENYINVNTQENGIFLKIIKTDPNAGPEIAKAGYYYTIKKNGVVKDDEKITFTIINGEVHINSFPTNQEMPNGTELISAFNNEIILFNVHDFQIGHISFEYKPEIEYKYKREAVIILHNDNELDPYIPYMPGSLDYDEDWNYYKVGEYPVSMLIPPKNSFSDNYTKTPLLLIHGWEGKFSLEEFPDAIAKYNETSYWFTTVKRLNLPNSTFDTWQYYYPYNTAHHPLAICLKSALGSLKIYYPDTKIRIITHSMGGLIALRYLTYFPANAQEMVEKVLFSAPPAHGSLGANLFYKNNSPTIHYNNYNFNLLECLVGYDSDAPSVRDMTLGSDATWDIFSKQLPDLSNQPNGIADDYFVLLGTTFKYYKTDTYFQIFSKTGIPTPDHICISQEAANHHDGIVSISSGSLLDKGVGFATFHGNHNDAVHMQSFIRDDKTKQNIGIINLLPEIITNYFTNDYSSFVNAIKENQNITAIVTADGENRTVCKPIGQNLENMNTNNGVEYQKGILNVELSEFIGIDEFSAYYNENNNVLVLISPQYSVNDYLKKGVFKHVDYNQAGTNRFYFNEKVLLAKEKDSDNKAIAYNGCAINLNQGENWIYIIDEKKKILGGEKFDFRFCETVNVSVNISNSKSSNQLNNFTDTKEKYIIQDGIIVPDSLKISFNIDDQADLVDFSINCIESTIYNFPVELRMKLPDGTLSDSTLAGATYQHDHNLGVINMQIPNPMPGKWHVWLESDHAGADTMMYNAIAFLQSKVDAWLPDTIEVITAYSSFNLHAGLKVNDFNLTSEINVIATVYRPDGGSEIFDITPNGITQDSSFIYNINYPFDIPGEYLLKYNIEGVYNNNNFERCLYYPIEAIDTLPVLYIPDIVLRQQESQQDLDLSELLYNLDNYDTLYFSSEILNSNIDSSAFSATLDSLSLNSYLYTNLSDSGTVVMRYTCHFDDNEISDTVVVKVLLPEMTIENLQLSDSIVSNGTTVAINYDLRNSGNFDAAEYEVRYFISQDSVIQSSDNCLGIKTILYHNVDTVLSVFDTIQLPVLDLAGNYNLLMKVDASDMINEVDESNNLALKNIYLNPPPTTPIILSAIPENENVQLTWTSNNETGITGYIIYYGMDTTDISNKFYPLNNDTTYTVPGLISGNTYYFAVAAYKIMGVNSNRSAFVSATITFSSFSIKIFLEGNFNGIEMKTDLNENNLIPLSQPYYSLPWFYEGLESVTAITNVEIVDWVLVELRETTGGPETALPNTVIARKAGFLIKNGFIVDLDGISPLRVDANISYNLFAVVYHRNHLPVMSANPLIESNGVYNYDYTVSNDQSYGGSAAVKELAPGIWGMMAGDGNADGMIDIIDRINVWKQEAGKSGYKSGDFNIDIQVDNSDKNNYWRPNEGKGSQVPE